MNKLPLYNNGEGESITKYAQILLGAINAESKQNFSAAIALREVARDILLYRLMCPINDVSVQEHQTAIYRCRQRSAPL